MSVRASSAAEGFLPAGAHSFSRAEFGEGRSWGIYLFLAVCLMPLATPIGPAQMAAVDLLNAVGVGAFALIALARRTRIEFPFVVPVFLIAAGSLVAVVNSQSAAQSFVTLIQDAYLYLWFVMLVNLMRPRGDLVALRLTWMVVASIMAVIGTAALLTQEGVTISQLVSSKGNRAFATFLGPNPFAHFLVLSFFVGLSLQGRIHRILLWPCLGVLLFATLATKSAGASVAMLCGLTVWGIVRAMTKRVAALALAAALLLTTGLGSLGWWVGMELGWDSPPLKYLESHTYAGKVEHSSESRFQIWDNLVRRYIHSPLGIGPGNSRLVPLAIPERVRRDSFLSKEAHNDYLAYLFERGPVALVGLLILTGAAGLLLRSAWREGRDPQWRAGVGGAFVAAMAGGLVATSIHSLVIEKLHFRVFWLFLAVLVTFREPMRQALEAATHRTRGGPDAGSALAVQPVRLT